MKILSNFFANTNAFAHWFFKTEKLIKGGISSEPAIYNIQIAPVSFPQNTVNGYKEALSTKHTYPY
jgi:hypothetical protein